MQSIISGHDIITLVLAQRQTCFIICKPHISWTWQVCANIHTSNLINGKWYSLNWFWDVSIILFLLSSFMNLNSSVHIWFYSSLYNIVMSFWMTRVSPKSDCWRLCLTEGCFILSKCFPGYCVVIIDCGVHTCRACWVYMYIGFIISGNQLLIWARSLYVCAMWILVPTSCINFLSSVTIMQVQIM